MLFNSYEFILGFLPVFLLCAYLGFRFRGRSGLITVTILASLFFYGWWDWRALPLLMGCVLVNHLLVHQLASPHRVVAFWGGVFFNLAILFFFKYAIFFANEVVGRPGMWFGLQSIILPLGVSFFTFQQIAYLTDIYTGRAHPTDLRHYALFMLFYPHYIAGPIVRHNELLPQFDSPRFRLSWNNVAIGMAIFSIGLCKKVLLADRFAPMSDDVFAAASNGEPLSLLAAWGGALAFSLQIYFDFSAYSDMAIGLSRMLGIRLPENFRSPYKSTSFIDFWRRWHITLSRFLRDYLYKPLGGNRQGFVRQLANLLIVMVLGGFWHGAGWTFLIWGAIHGACLAVNHILVRVRQVLWLRRRTAWGERLLGWAIVQLLVIVAWIFFRASDLQAAMTMLKGMASHGSGMLLPASVVGLWAKVAPVPGWIVAAETVPHFHGLLQVSMLGAGLFVAVALPNTAQIMRRYRPVIYVSHLPTVREGYFAWRMTVIWAVITAAFFGLGFMGLSKVNEFIYFQF